VTDQKKFRAVLADLSNTARVFHTESAEFDKIMGVGCIVAVSADSGDGSLNATMQLVLDEMQTVHTNIALWMFAHGDKLQKAHDNYQAVETNVHELFDDLMPDMG
jgi:hypothetical protein